MNNMSQGIIGYTGFVGSNLSRQMQFEQFYNSQNIESIVGKNFSLLVCAGAPAGKWLANKEPIKDRDNLQRLIDCLRQVSAQQIILISTVDVYNLPVEVDENTEIEPESLQPYGKHRRELENFVRENFDYLIVRLPGLFGSGLKKNIIYDLLHQNLVEKIHQDSVFQFYNLEHLGKDIQTAREAGLKLINFATAPTSVREVAAKAFEFEFTNQPNSPPVRYNMKTKYSQIFASSEPGYLYSKNQVLLELKDFVCQFKH